MNWLENFSSPLHLLLLAAALPLVLWLSRRSLAGLGKARRWVCIALRILVVLFLVLALAETRLLWRNDRLAVIFLIDRSASVPPEHQSAALDFVRSASQYRNRERGDAAGLVAFGRTAGIESSPKPEELALDGFSTVIERDFTDVQAAIRLAMAAFPEGYGKRLVIITDGNENRGRALEEARAASSAGATIDVLSVRYRYAGEILLDKLVVDPEVHVGEPFDVRIVVESTRESRATLRLFENRELIQSQEVQLKAGKNVFTVPRRLELADLYYYEALVEPSRKEDDGIFQNNGAHAFTFIRGQPRILLCADDPSLDGSLVDALASERIKAHTLRPESLPNEPEGYLQYDAIIFSNVSADRLAPAKMQMFENLVRAAGIGFVMLGGDASFGAGGYMGTPIEELLPVSMDVKQKKSLPNGALAMVIHSCEINNGNFWAKETVQRAIKVLSPADYAGVLYYDGMGGERWLFPMTPCIQKAMMLGRLQGFAPGDMPDFSRIMTMALNGLKNTPAMIKHMIVFSDGDPSMPSNQLIQQIRQSKITISTICMGWHSAPDNMKWLAQQGAGNYYELTGPERLPEIFIREAVTVKKALIQEKDFKPLVRRGGSYLAGLDLESLPALRGYVIASQKEQADQFLAAPPVEGDPILDPILSSWQYGLGKSVAFTSDGGRRWAALWASWSGYQKFWGQTLRWVSRVRSDDRFRVTREQEGDSAAVLIDAVDPAGNFVNGIDFEGTVMAPDFQTAPIEVRQMAPGRYRAEFPIRQKGTYLASLKYLKDGKPQIYSTGVTVPYSPEYRKLETNDFLLERLAAAAQGKVLDRLGEPARLQAVFGRDFPATTTPQDLWRDLLKLAALFFFIDVFVRRVAIDYQKAIRASWQHVAAWVTRRSLQPAPADPRLSALLKKKTAVWQAQPALARKFFEAGDQKGQEPALDASFIAGASKPSEKKSEKADKPDITPAPQKVPRQPAEAESYTSRLLAAKRRALENKEKKPPDSTNR